MRVVVPGLCVFAFTAAFTAAFTGSLAACQSGPRPTLRALPTTLSSDAARLLTGCEVQDSVHELEIRCPDGVVVGRDHLPPVLDASWVGVATERGFAITATLTWSDRALVTDMSPLPLREARFTDGGGRDVGFLVGVSRPDGATREDLWCTNNKAGADAVAHCESILTALVQPPVPVAVVITPDATVDTSAVPVAGGGETVVPPTRVDAPRLRGRALSLPTTCGVQAQHDTNATYRCEGLTLGWRTAEDMEAAADEADALLASLATDEEPVPLPCRLGYEASVCRGTATIVVGTAFLEGVAVVASCVAREGTSALTSAPCRTLMNGSW